MATGQVWTDKGQEFAIDQLDKNTAVAAASFSYFGAWGSSATTPAVTDNALVSENAEARTSIPAGSMSQPAADTVRYTYTITATGSRTVQETGVATASTVGNFHNRIVHGSLTLVSGDSVAYTTNLRLKDTSE